MQKLLRRLRYRLYHIRKRPWLQLQFMAMAFCGLGIHLGSKEIIALSVLAFVLFFIKDARPEPEQDDEAGDGGGPQETRGKLLDFPGQNKNQDIDSASKPDYEVVQPPEQ